MPGAGDNLLIDQTIAEWNAFVGASVVDGKIFAVGPKDGDDAISDLDRHAAIVFKIADFTGWMECVGFSAHMGKGSRSFLEQRALIPEALSYDNLVNQGTGNFVMKVVFAVPNTGKSKKIAVMPIKHTPKPDTKLLCVFCGSQSGGRKIYSNAANAVGDEIARQGMGLVFGGGKIGLMGTVADAVLAGGGPVVGVIPDVLMTKELAHENVTKLEVVSSMHERKARMAELASGFLTLPGGIGTFEEFFEIVTWAVLGIHQKPIGLLNVDGYFDPILRLLGHAVEEKFLRPQHLDLILVGEDPAALVSQLASHRPPSVGPLWLDLNQS